MFQLARFGAEIARVGEVDASLLVEAHVIRRVETLFVVAIGDGDALFGFDIPTGDAAAAEVKVADGAEGARANSAMAWA